MTNFEHFKDDILKLAADEEVIACSKEKHTVTDCYSTECEECLFHAVGRTCYLNRIEWLYEEYKEPVNIELTPFARALLERLSKKGYHYAARAIANGVLYFYETKPILRKPNRVSDYWDDGHTSLRLDVLLDDFQFIKKTDTEPWEIAEILRSAENDT